MQNRKAGAGPQTAPASWQFHLVIAGLVALFFREILLRTSFFWEDFLYQYYAFRSFAAASLASGELPLWNPYTFNGMPFQADIQSAIFYVPNLLLTPFAAGGSLDYWWVELSIVLHFVLAGSGMFLLARNFDLDRWAAAFAGIAYCFSGFMVGHLIHQGFIYQAAWLPLIFLAFRRALTEGSLYWSILCGLLLGHALLAGAPQVTLYIVLYLFLYTLFEAVQRAPAGVAAVARIGGLAAVPIGLALLLTAAQLLPTAELAPLSQRAEISYEKAVEGSFVPSQIVTMAVPKYFGARGAREADFILPGPYWQYWETQGFFGAAALALAAAALAALRKRPIVWFLTGTIVFAFLYALGDGFLVHGLFHRYVPGFETFRVPGRMMLFVCFSGSLLAAFGLHHVLELSQSAGGALGTRRIAAWIAAGALLAAVVGATGALLPPIAGASGVEAARRAASASYAAAGVLAATALLVFLLGRGTIPRGVFAALLLVVQFADAHSFGFSQNNGATDPDAYYARTARLVDYFREEGKKELFRINSREHGAMILDRNQGMIDRIFLMEGYTPLGLARFIPPMSTWQKTCDLLNAKYRIVVDMESGSMSMTEAKGYLPRAFVVHRAHVAASPDEAKARLSDPAFDPREEVVFESPPPALPASPAPGGAPAAGGTSTATVESYTLNELTLTARAAGDGYLVLSEIWYPGWKAYVDGVETPILRADWCLRAVPLAAGEHSVRMVFSPSSFTTGAWISATTLALSAAGVWHFGRKKERT